MIKVISHALTVQESIIADLECLRRSNRSYFTGALEQIVQCYLKAFTEKQWASDPCRSTENVEIVSLGQGGQTAVAEGLAWKYSES